MSEKSCEVRNRDAVIKSRKKSKRLNETKQFNQQRSASRCQNLLERNEINLDEFFQISAITNLKHEEECKIFNNRCEATSCNLVYNEDYSSNLNERNKNYNCDCSVVNYTGIKDILKTQNSQQKENISMFDSKYFENLKIEIEFVESSQNYQGNYHNYVSKSLKSIIPIRQLNFADIIEEKKIILYNNEISSKKILILDLDETLVHADFDLKLSDHDQILTFEYEGYEVDVPIILRPGVFQFLENVADIFDVFVFTASKREYADAVLNFLDPHSRIFKKRFYREYCINIKNKLFIKDLRIFANCNLENIVIVDNSIYSFLNQLSNGILINSFYNDKTDRELYSVFNYLQQYLSKCSDIRIVNEKIFNFILEEYAQNPLL